LNPLLARQLRKHLPDLDPAAPAWAAFLAVVDAAYTESAQDRAFLEHTLEVTSSELTEANDKLRQEAENRLASLSRYYQQTLELQQGMILCVRHTPRGFEHTLCRGQLLARLGLTSEEMENHLVEELAAPPQAALLNAAYARAWAGEECSLSFTTGEGVELFVLMRPRRENGEVREIIASCVEITALKEAERELRAAKERAEAADRAKSQFLAVMSHEIRTPLNAVIGFSALLQESPLNEEQRSWLQTIDSSGEALLALIDDILDFSKIEAGFLRLHAEPVAVRTLLDAVASMFHHRAQAKGIAIRVIVAPPVPASILTDAHRLRQILVNLVGNAVKFTKEGSIVVEARVVEPPEAPGGCLLRFFVTDTGIGIPRDRLERLFKPFSQVDSSTTRTYGGTGLGLAICHRLAHLLGGEIGVETDPGAGSTFFFSIRAPVADASAKARPESAIPEVHLPPGSGPRLHALSANLQVLIAEDHPDNRRLIRDFLTDQGVKPDLVENGRLAIDAARKKIYDVILMDLQMPEVDGYAATRAIRRHFGDTRPPRIYALTANVFSEDRERCIQAGMDGVLTKPVNFNELVRVLAARAPEPFRP